MRRTLLVLGCLLFSCTFTGCAGPRPADAIMESGDRYFRLGDYTSAASEYEQVASRYPGDWRAQYRLGITRLELGEYTQARRALEIAHTRRPDDMEVAEALAEAMYEQRSIDDLYAFLHAQVENTRSVRACLVLAQYSLALGDLDSAKLAIDSAIAWDGGRSVEPHMLAAELAERVGDEQSMILELQRAYALDPHDEQISQRLRAHGVIPGPTMTP
jgi:tetratricopeptide (TPR) repeat protein